MGLPASWPVVLLLLLLCRRLLPGYLCSRGEYNETRDLCEEIVRKDGYPCQSYTVITKDGFLLGLHRIPGGYDKEEVLTKRPVFLQHGLLQVDTHLGFNFTVMHVLSQAHRGDFL